MVLPIHTRGGPEQHVEDGRTILLVPRDVHKIGSLNNLSLRNRRGDPGLRRDRYDRLSRATESGRDIRSWSAGAEGDIRN